MKKLKSINLLTRHGDEKHFKVKRKNSRPAEALIEKKYFFLYHIIIYDGTKVYEGIVTFGKLNRILNNINKEFPRCNNSPTAGIERRNHGTTY